MQAGQMDGPRDRERSDTRMNHHAARGLQPAPWSGEDDPMAFQEFSAEFTNFANALNPGSKHLLDQATRIKGVIDINLDLRELPLVEGLAEALDGEIYRQLYKSTKGEARRVVHNAGSGNGLQAWLNLNNAYAPRSATDAAVAMKRVMYPTRVKTEAQMPIELQKWLADLLEFEQRFHPMDDTSKRCGLQMLLPETMWQNRMAGQQYETFYDLLKHVKDLVGDRTLAAMKTKPTTHHHHNQGPQPMDIGQFDETDLNAFGGKGKGGKGPNTWGQPSWGQPKGDKGKGKAKGKGQPKGEKGKGKGKDVQCWTCSGWGHRSNQCPNDTGKGVNEVAEGPQAAAPEEHQVTEEPGEDEEPPWLGMLTDAPRRKRGKTTWSPMNIVFNRGPTPTTGFHTRSRTTGRSTNYEGYNQFSLLEDADDYDDDAGHDEIMLVTEAATKTEAATTTRWTKVSTIVDSGAVEHVLPEHWLPTIRMEESPGSRVGKKYLSATGQEIPNLGQKALYTKTREGQSRGICFQVAPVRKPLMSVAKMNEAGNDVNLRGNNPHIMNIKTKEITALRREGKTFILDLWVKIPGALKNKTLEVDPTPNKSFGFTRRG